MARFVGMRMVAAACLALLIVPLDAGAVSAFGYRDKGLDPDDRKAIGYDPDVRSTTRRVWQSPNGWRFLSVKFRAYEELGVYWGVNARLDSRRGPRADYIMGLYNADNGGADCSIWEPGRQDTTQIDGRFYQGTDYASCRVPLKVVHRDKRIRWRLVSRSGYVKDNWDIAPNGGGYYP
jgi:hypothetical protein